MAAETFGTTGLVFGLTQETGVLATSIERVVQRQKKEVMDADGDIVGVGYYAPKAEYTIQAVYLNLGTGVGIAAPGTLLTLANQSNANGVSGGTLVTDEVTETSTNEDFSKFSIKATQYPSI